LKAAPLRFRTVRLLADPGSLDIWTSQRSRSLNLTVNSVLVQETALSATEVDGRVVVLSLQAASYFDFNKVASEIWGMLSSPRRVEDILQNLSRHHDVDIEIMTRDVMSFLQSLVTQRLVRIVAVEDAR
jgi:Coenzyme PQQ synthesis protein D (PqqD)